MLLLEGIRNVREEDQAAHDVFVLGGVHVGSQRIGGPPEVVLEAKVRSVICVGHAELSLLDEYALSWPYHYRRAGIPRLRRQGLGTRGYP